MNVQTIWSLAGSIIASVGGAGVIICAVAGYVSTQVAKHLDVKYEQRLNKELEQFKSSLDQRRYITKAQFDREFDIYYTLSENYYSMVMHLTTFTHDYNDKVLHPGTNSLEQAKDSLDTLDSMIHVMAEAQNNLYRNVAFMPKEIYERYDILYREASQLFGLYSHRILQLIDTIDTNASFDDVVTNADRKTANQLLSDFDELNKKLREYLNTLSVVS